MTSECCGVGDKDDKCSVSTNMSDLEGHARAEGIGVASLKSTPSREHYIVQAACSVAVSTDLGDCSEVLTEARTSERQDSRNEATSQAPDSAMEHMLRAERDGWARRPQGDFLLQQGISAGDRASVVDSMTRVATQLQLPSDDLFLAVACLDRFLAAGSLQPCFLDAAALACLWLATKFEHRLGPSALQFLAAAQLDCTSRADRSLLIDMEARILKALDYRMQPYPTTKTFLRTIFDKVRIKLEEDQHLERQKDSKTIASSKLKMNALPQLIDPRLYYTASYLAEASLLEYKSVPCAPSQVAAAVFASANLLVGCPLHDDQLLELTGYTLGDIKPAMQWLLAVHHVLYEGRTLPVSSMYETARKHRHSSVCRVALIPSISSVRDPRLNMPC